MRDFSDSLTADLLTEAYASQAAADQNDRSSAEKAYKAELINGPKKTVTTANGSTFQIAVGTFDLQNMHKAYDAYYSENGLLKLFANDGKLIGRGTYGDMKSLDKSEPAVKALLKLWGTQFKGDMPFTADKNAEDAAMKAESDAAEKRKELEAAIKERLPEEIKKLPA